MRPALLMDLDRWRRIEAILDVVLDLPPEERSAILDETCAGDAELRAQVEALLAADAEAGVFLSVPIGEYASELLAGAVGEGASEVTDLAGHQVGRYRLLREIGSGAMGAVYEAQDTQLGRSVAVKLLPPEYSRNRRVKERFLREARTAASVDHPNLCTVHDAGESEGRLYIVLSFYEGETLQERIRRGPLPLAEAREVAIQVARGLARAHGAGIVHRDIKPSNVILPRHGEAKILDFGVARTEGVDISLTRTGLRWGTPAYMSPEHSRGEPVNGRTDIWSLGVMLYEMIAGRRPFRGESFEALVSSVLTQEPEPLERLRPDAPLNLIRVVDRALAKKPAERYANVGELLADLESTRAPDRRPTEGKALRVTLVTGALTVLALAAVLLWGSWKAVEPPLRVAILHPVVKSATKNPETDFVVSDVVAAALSSLVSMENVQPLDPPERGEEKGMEAVRLQEADEALLPLLDCRKVSCQVSFHRRKPNGLILAVSEPFEVQGGFDYAYQLMEGVRVHVRQVYSDHPLRRGSSSGAVRPEDYSAYIALRRRVDRGEHPSERDLDRLDALMRTSPGLIGAYVLAMGVARGQGDFDRALDYAAQAENLAPYDPRPLIARLLVELEGNRLDAAPATLARLESLAPGDIRVKTARADLLETRGELEKARSLREEVARRRPTWRHILTLATLEARSGESDSARHRLGDLLAIQPDNQFVRERLAGLETVYGNLQRAAVLYTELTRGEQSASYLSRNLGTVRLLLGDYAAATAVYRQALAKDPDDLVTRLNLATTLGAQGDLVGARRLYRALAEELAAAPARLDAHTRLLHAQCLVHLGERAEATRIAGVVLKQTPADLQVLYQAAQVYALLGDRVPALFYTDLALKKGLRKVWFSTPEFRSLKRDQAFQSLLNRSTDARTNSSGDKERFSAR